MSIDPSAQYYQDPEARLKLRVYLASPQKFDEAVEFGFPPLFDKENEGGSGLARPSTRTKKAVEDSNRTFFQDDTASTCDDDIAPDATERTGHFEKQKETDSYTTRPEMPRAHTEQPRRHTLSTRRQSESRILQPRTVSANGNYANIQPYAKSSAHNRQMTLKMTLTRPDLRTTEEEAAANDTSNTTAEFLPPGSVSYFATATAGEAPWTRGGKDDALRLGDLSTLGPGQAENIWDTMPEDKGVMKKMWRKIRMR